jgi:formylglycine-generating enzyme required for sulfatase activity
MPDQQPSKPQVGGRKLGHGANHQHNLIIVLEFLLDLAGKNSNEVWEEIKRKIGANQCKNLQQALIVRWDMSVNKKYQLLVTSARRDPGGQDDALIADIKSSTGTLEAIRLCLETTKRKLDQTGRQANTPEKNFDTDQIRNALNLLLALQLFNEDKLKRNNNQNSMNDAKRKQSNNPYWSFWIDFSLAESNRKDKCLELVNVRWENQWGKKQPATGTSSPSDPEVKLKATLDTWVSSHLESWSARFEALEDVMQRRIHVPLKADIIFATAIAQTPPGEAESRELKPEDVKAVVAARGSQMVLIWEEGGAGKTSLAFQIARWGIKGTITGHAILPVLVDPAIGSGDIVDRMHRQLLNVDEELTPAFVRDLWRHRRLLPIIDHVSELTDNQRQWLSQALLPHLVLLTSRQRESSLFSAWSITEIKPQRLEGEALLDFFEAYLDAKGQQSSGASAAAVLSPEDQVQTRGLLERMVGNKPITVLLAWMVINKAIEHIAEGRIDLLPSSVPELMLDYVERSGKNIAPENQRLADGSPLQPGWIQASLKALALAAHRQDNEAYRPQNFELPLALEALTKINKDGQALASEAQRRSLLLYLQEKLNLLQRKGGSDSKPIYRLALDPLADYMAALALMEELNGGRDPAALDDLDHFNRVRDWLDLLDSRLGRDEGEAGPLMRGFLAACRDGYKELLSRAPTSLELPLRQKWEELAHTFARLAGIDPQEERKLEARHLIRRHAGDLFWANPELLPKAIAELSAFAQEFAGGRELDQAVRPLARTMAKANLPEAVRSAAAEALGRIGGAEVARALVLMIHNTNEACVAVRRAAAEALGLVDARPDKPEGHWQILKELLADDSNHLHGETDQAKIDRQLPVLQGASRGLQRLAARCSPFTLPVLGNKESPVLEVPMLTLTIASAAVTTEAVPIKVWQLPLPGGLLLELVEIPAGEFRMGSPRHEDFRNAYAYLPEATNVDVEAQRLVRLPAFAMARTPINQAQWRAVAKLPQVASPLDADPAQAKGDELPVECVSWNDANEWCARLNSYLLQLLGKECAKVKLPSEAQWEYACRAGSSNPLPFHFGDTLDAAWANYDANYTYGGGKVGVYLNHTSPVGAYGLVNQWGLADMHGNVWEWCEDFWHPSLEQGPTDGSSWLDLAADLPEAIAQKKLLRGGSWYDNPGYCRSAFRNNVPPGNRINAFGFRVCCLPQD